MTSTADRISYRERLDKGDLFHPDVPERIRLSHYLFSLAAHRGEVKMHKDTFNHMADYELNSDISLDQRAKDLMRLPLDVRRYSVVYDEHNKIFLLARA